MTQHASHRLALLFDLDGTLVDSVYQHVLAWHKALEEMGLSPGVWRIHRRIGSEARGSDHHSKRSRTRKAGSGPLSGCGAKSQCSHLPRDGCRRQCQGPVGRPESRLSRDLGCFREGMEERSCNK